MSTQKLPLKITNQLSHSAIKVFACRRRDSGDLIRGAQSTGFLWQHENSVYCITNWHNVTGWDPIKDRPLSTTTGFVPTLFNFTITLAKSAGDGLVTRDRREATISLFDDQSRPMWLEHPTFGRRVDVVALRVAELDAKLLTQPVNTYAGFVDYDVSVGDDVYVLGFPLGLEGGADFPIWKRGSIASEPEIDVDGLPKVLIDTATRKGMSGSPVIAVNRGITNPRGSKGFSANTIMGQAETFLGVYSGRVDDDPLGAQIGIVWKATVVDQIIGGSARGTSPT